MNTETILCHYIECALWSSTDNSRDDGGDPLDDNYAADDIHPDSVASMRKDIEDMLAYCKENTRRGEFSGGSWSAGPDLELYEGSRRGREEQFGHDFWLTRNGHGAGFWDRGLGGLGDALTEASKTFGSSDLYVGDDGELHVT